MLRDTGLRDDVRSDLKHINIQAERAARIVQNLLVFAREHKPERRMVNLNEEFRNTLSLRAYQLRVDNITVLNQVGARAADDCRRPIPDPAGYAQPD